jgi:D-amino-acid dehydrogenase
MPRPAMCPRTPMIFPETKVAVTPWESGYRLGSTMEFAGYDTTIHRARLDLLRNGARNYLREPYCEPVLEEWYGWRPMTWDSVPIIDRAPRWDNVYIAAGHNMLGLSMATGTGKLIRELVLGETPHLDPSHYRATRFQRP